LKLEMLHGDSWAKTYLLIDEESKQAILIDSVFGRHEYDLSVIQARGATLKHAIATHTHADHVTACFDLREKTGCEYVMWKDTVSLGISKFVDEDDVIMLGKTSLKFHFSPGHTNDSMIVEIPGHILTGDFLFNGEAGVGRDDLPSGRPKIHFEALSLLNRFDDEVMVQSGHDPPGTVMRTLGWNRKNNPILKMETYAEYIAWQERQWEILGPVTQIKIAVPANIFAEAPESDVTNKPS